jgi:curved DNA-binding protein
MKKVKDYYKILNVDKTASAEEIKKSYHRLARLFHPDRNKSKKDTVEKFNEVNEAYKVLGNLDMRLRYSMLLNNEKRLLRELGKFLEENSD